MFRPYAVHYPQLIDQALRLGWREAELRSLRRAHDYAMNLFHGLYRGQGAPFLNHVVRTASIVMAEKGPVEAANAALLHAAYFFGRFRDARRGDTPNHRREVVSEIGTAAESLVRLYNETPFHDPMKLEHYLNETPVASQEQKRVWLVRLANELEDYLDNAMAFRSGYPMRETLEKCEKKTLELARRLGHSQLANELAQAFRASLEAQIPESLMSGHAEVFEMREHGGVRAVLRKLLQ